MIDSLQDRLEVLAKKTTFTGSERPQVSELVTSYMLRVNGQANALLARCQSIGSRDVTDKDAKDMGSTLVDIVNSALMTMHLLEITPPDNEEVNELLDTLAEEIRQDKILSTILIVRSASEGILSYYIEEGETSDELEDALCDVICGAICLAELIGYEASDLITGSI